MQPVSALRRDVKSAVQSRAFSRDGQILPLGVLPQVKAPTLLIAGGADSGVIELNQWALEGLGGEKSIKIVPGATHLFPEPGAFEAVIELAAAWFERHLVSDHPIIANRDARR
ncbi:alpha/beta hydrolase family protein [Bradyrhizobium sp.]|uniref:alpha/beta hydrolase family protein n=1 Tax=Bradyrhizobium sp. TaxID=376 RepID=UPI003C764FD9